MTTPTPKVTRSDEEWRAELSPAEYEVLRRAGTERPWTGKYVESKDVGVYAWSIAIALGVTLLVALILAKTDSPS